MPVNTTQLRINLLSELNGIVSSDDIEDFLLLVSSLDILSTDRAVSVSTVNDLPDATTIPQGTVLYVTSIKVLVVSAWWYWLGLDGRILRTDVPSASLFSWGSNTAAQLGNNEVGSFSSVDINLETVVGGITNWSKISASSYNGLGVTDAGIAYAWGNNNSGAVGDGTSINRSSPVTVVGGITNWSELIGGGGFTLGLTDSGVLYAWGSGTYGRLGTGYTTDQSSPVTVIGGITNWSQVSSGRAHSLGVTATGIAYAWGFNTFFGTPSGQLGDNTSIDRSSPVTIVGGITNWSQVSASPGFRGHSLGVTSTGIAYAWGYNSSGQLGNGIGGYGTNQSSPVTVVGGITNWSQVSAGGDHSLGLTDSGVLYSWGRGSRGQLGTGDGSYGNNQSSPVTVIGGITNWSQVSAGDYHSLGLTSTGIAYAWGYGRQHRLGTGSLNNQSSPVTVIGGINTWSQISAGRDHSMGLKS